MSALVLPVHPGTLNRSGVSFNAQPKAPAGVRSWFPFAGACGWALNESGLAISDRSSNHPCEFQ